MTAALKHGSPRKLLCGGRSARRTRFPGGETGVLGEGMDTRSRGARRGMGPGTCARVAEITSGRAISQQGLAATCKDLARKGEAEARGGFWSGAWARRSEDGGPVWTLSRPGPALAGCDEETGKPPPRGVYASQRLSFRLGGQARALTDGVQGRDQNRTRELRPSGIAGGLWETWPCKGARADARATATSATMRAPNFHPDNRTHGLKGERGTGPA
jgi:hypothetical protein